MTIIKVCVGYLIRILLPVVKNCMIKFCIGCLVRVLTTYSKELLYYKSMCMQFDQSFAIFSKELL